MHHCGCQGNTVIEDISLTVLIHEQLERKNRERERPPTPPKKNKKQKQTPPFNQDYFCNSSIARWEEKGKSLWNPEWKTALIRDHRSSKTPVPPPPPPPPHPHETFPFTIPCKGIPRDGPLLLWDYFLLDSEDGLKRKVHSQINVDARLAYLLHNNTKGPPQ